MAFRHARFIVALGAAGAAPLWACAPDANTVGVPDTGTDAGTDEEDAAPPSKMRRPDRPRSISFVESDPTVGVIGGELEIGRAQEEEDVAGYRVYWSTDQVTRLGPALRTFPASGEDIVAHVTATIPSGARYLIAFSYNQDGESEPITAEPLEDAVHRDISAGQPDNSGLRPTLLLDGPRRRLIAAAIRSGANSTIGIGLFVCTTDGDDCTHHDVSGTLPIEPSTLSLAIDERNAKILVGATSSGFPSAPQLFRCNLAGNECVRTEIPSPNPNNSNARFILDEPGAKLVVAADTGGGRHLGLWRCELDGSGCGFVDVSAATGQGTMSGYAPALDLDEHAGKVVIATEAGLYRCASDGSACTYSDYRSGLPIQQPSILVDEESERILIAAARGTDYVKDLSLFRCSIDGSSCSHTDISGGRQVWAYTPPSLVLDPVEDKLLIAVQQQELGAYRCNRDGTGCSFAAFSVKRNAGELSGTLDYETRRLLVAGSDSSKLALFSFGPWP